VAGSARARSALLAMLCRRVACRRIGGGSGTRARIGCRGVGRSSGTRFSGSRTPAPAAPAAFPHGGASGRRPWGVRTGIGAWRRFRMRAFGSRWARNDDICRRARRVLRRRPRGCRDVSARRPGSTAATSAAPAARPITRRSRVGRSAALRCRCLALLRFCRSARVGRRGWRDARGRLARRSLGPVVGMRWYCHDPYATVATVDRTTLSTPSKTGGLSGSGAPLAPAAIAARCSRSRCSPKTCCRERSTMRRS
jgi:hypothetical protein